MPRRALVSPAVVSVVLILQVIPLVLFPPALFSLKTQDWWLPVLLAVMLIAADVQIIGQRSVTLSPWNLLAFAQGFNIISRLMMVWAHATVLVGRVRTADTLYIGLTLVSIIMSVFVLWYTEKPEVRMAFLPR